MIKGALRFIGFWLLAAAVVAIVIDGTRTIAANGLVWTPFVQTWLQLHSNSLTALQGLLEKSSAILWNPGMTSLLRLPTVVVFSSLALICLWIGQPSRDILE